MSLREFRTEVRAWLDENCPESMRTPMSEDEIVSGGSKQRSPNPDSYVWLDRMASRGWTVPDWPEEYGGAGLSKEQYMVLFEEMSRINARIPLTGMGVSMIGPTLLEYGTDEQKAEHLPKIASGEIRWCQGYSEPGAGSDLASLNTRAVEQGDHFVINGQKIWTTLAQHADWIFCLVRTDPDAPKHEGISFMLVDMAQSGVTTKPIRLISGTSPFCETFFDDALAEKKNLIDRLNKGWTVGKRLLQHERSGIQALAQAAAGRDARATAGMPIEESAKAYVGSGPTGKIADPVLRGEITAHLMNTRALSLTQARSLEESQGGTPGFTTSVFKLRGAELRKEQLELQLKARGTQALGWAGESFSDEERDVTRNWLGSKAGSIAGGSNEVQMNIIAKRVLGLPDV
ncbi:MAG: acyl-CoA dehydrogenase family protein [Pseudomonadota bacterium]|nr:acyl-CoA dehydrogenase family protein [Pseudomonadota bacterium]